MRRVFIPALLLLVLLTACGPAGPVAAPATPEHADQDTVLAVWPAESRVAFTAHGLGGRLELQGTYGVQGGSVTLKPEESRLRIHAFLIIDTPSVTVGNAIVDEALKLGMETASFPIATFDALSTTLVPVTEQPIQFTLEGTLTLHGQTQPVVMAVGPATVIDNHLIADAAMPIDLADFGIALPEAVVDSAIQLHVTLIADENAPPSAAHNAEEGAKIPPS